MGKTLTEIAKQLNDADKKVQLIYAFNGSGKTRLSRKFKQLIAPKANGGTGGDEAEPSEPSRSKILYYNGIPTIRRKTALALERASGIMIWQILGDTPDDRSLLAAINEVAFGRK